MSVSISQYYEDKVDLEQLPSMLDYVYDGIDDISEAPSVQEYHKLKRIMRIMVRFYQKGSNIKFEQKKAAEAELAKLETDVKMVEAQIEALSQFPPVHPKRRAYEDNLNAELDALNEKKPVYEKKVAEFKGLAEWSNAIVSAVKWLEESIEDYVNNNLQNIVITLRETTPLTKEQMEIHARGLDEITYNLQESQDFFEASLDGRLKRFHQLEKCMIEAQLQAIRKFPEDNLRRKHMEEELQKDLEFVTDNMFDDPKKQQHKERMKSMHEDFFQVLRWNRKKLRALRGLPEMYDEEELSKPAANGESLPSTNGCPVDKNSLPASTGCPMKC